MINNEILSFIKEQIAQGATKDKVKDMLVTQGGWDEKDVEEAFETINFSATSYPAVLKNAAADAATNSIRIEEKDKNLGGVSVSLTPVQELTKAVLGNVRPTVFSPGLSHVEQPKSMEPSVSGFSLNPLSAAETTPASRMSVESRAGDAGGSNALASLRARITSGVSEANPDVEPVSIFRPVMQPATKEPAVFPTPIQKPPIAAPVIRPTPVISTAPRQPFLPRGAETAGGFSPFPSLNKTPMPPVVSASALSVQPAEPINVFPKSPLGAMSRPNFSPTPAQLATMSGQKQKGGRFLLGLMMFLVGLILGGISMNAYMKGYINISGIVEGGLDLIGLGTIPAPEISKKTTGGL